MGHRAWVEQVMGMPISISVRGPNVASAADLADGANPAEARHHVYTAQEQVETLVERAYADLRWVDATFSMWKDDSPIYQVSCGVRALDDGPPELAEVLALCEEAERRTAGAFTHHLPLCSTPLYRGDAGAGSRSATSIPVALSADDPYRRVIDPTGLVKGWAIARAARILDELHGHAYCVNAGGDIAVGGRDASADGNRPWRLGVENPYDRSEIAEVVELWDGGMATSGTAARGAHLIDPTTGRGIPREGSVTVVGPDVMWADVWATALFVGPPTLANELLTSDDRWSVLRL